MRLFFQSITENTIVPIYNACKVIFWDEFWKYFYIYKVYDKISVEHFKEIADGLCIPPNELLENKNLVEKFDTQITLVVREEVAPLILPDGDEVNAIRFDALMYGIELAYLVGKKYTKARSDLYKKVAGIASVANIPEIQAQADFINKILNTDYVEQAGIAEFEEIRERLRNLIKYIPKNIVRYDTNFEDDLLSIEWKDSELENDELKNYKAKAEYYIRQHQDNIAIAKLKTNQPLTATDIETLEETVFGAM